MNVAMHDVQPFDRDGMITAESVGAVIVNPTASRGSFDPFATAVESAPVVTSQPPDIFAELPIPDEVLRPIDRAVNHGRDEMLELRRAMLEEQTLGQKLGSLAMRAHNLKDKLVSIASARPARKEKHIGRHRIAPSISITAETPISDDQPADDLETIFRRVPMPDGILRPIDRAIDQGRAEILELHRAIPEDRTLLQKLGSLGVRAFRFLERAGIVEREVGMPSAEIPREPISDAAQVAGREAEEYLHSPAGAFEAYLATGTDREQSQ